MVVAAVADQICIWFENEMVRTMSSVAAAATSPTYDHAIHW